MMLDTCKCKHCGIRDDSVIKQAISKAASKFYTLLKDYSAYSLNVESSNLTGVYVIGKHARNSVRHKPFQYDPGQSKISIVETSKSFLAWQECTVKPLHNLKRSLFDRLHSFKDWPTSSIVSAASLVEAGFVHKEGEICLCAWCDITLDASTLNGKRPFDEHRKRNSNCEYVKNYTSNSSPDSHLSNPFGQNLNFSNTRRQGNDLQRDGADVRTSRPDSTNGAQRLGDITEDQPIPVVQSSTYSPRNPGMTRDQARRESFMYWPHTSLIDTDLIVEAGFFFTGTNDTVRCFYCDIGLSDWTEEDDPWVEHTRHNPDCPFLRQKKPRQYIEDIQRDWSQIYCPKHPEMSDLQDRLRTFINSSWPSDMVTQTPQQIASAGFYYTGEDDTVRCHYCDGGLREWEPEDDPWVEHGRWFPFCKYMLRTKGLEFIRMCSTDIPNSTEAAAAPAQRAPPGSQASGPAPVSFADECRKKEKKNPMFSAAAESVRGMGYSKSVLKSVINEYIAKTGRRTFNAPDLLEIIFAREEKGELISSENEDDSYENDGGSSEEEELELSPEAYGKEIEYLQNRITCIVCKSKERSMVFVPCGHRITCDTCSRLSDTCNSCGSGISRKIKTYLS